MLQISHQDRVTLQLVADGKTLQEIADRVSLHLCDVEGYLSALFAIMGATSRTEAIAAARRRGLLTTDDASEKPG
jgi:DNA-binding CsgD family transcriptional regulator